MSKIGWLNKIWVCLFTVTALSLMVGCTPASQTVAKTKPIPPAEDILRVGVSTNSPPLIFRQNDRVIGLEADFARALAQHLDKSLRFVELNWEDQIPALLENRIDIIMSGMSITALRGVRVAFTLSYFESGQMALIRRTDAARYGTGFFSLAASDAIGAIKDTTGEYFVESQFGSAKKRLYKNADAAVESLIDKDIDLFIHDAPMILYLASENETRGLTVLFALLTKEPLAWAVRKDNPNLLASANEFLKTLNETGKLNKMIKTWIPFTR